MYDSQQVSECQFRVIGRFVHICDADGVYYLLANKELVSMISQTQKLGIKYRLVQTNQILTVKRNHRNY